MRFSSVIAAHAHGHHPTRSVRSVDLQASSHLAAPFTKIDHFRVTASAIGPRLESGACAATYVLEDSTGNLRSRDSRGNDIVTRPGGLVWMRAGNKVSHEHRPDAGRELHGLSCCIDPGTAGNSNGSDFVRLDP